MVRSKTTDTPRSTADMPLLLDARAIVAALGGVYSEKTVRKMQRSGEIPSFKRRGKRLTTRETLLATVAAWAKKRDA
jgi:hypothetical protein